MFPYIHPKSEKWLQYTQEELQAFKNQYFQIHLRIIYEVEVSTQYFRQHGCNYAFLCFLRSCKNRFQQGGARDARDAP